MYSCVHATRTKEPRKCYQQLIYVPKLKGRHSMRIATAVIACLVDAMSLETIGTEKVSDEQRQTLGQLKRVRVCIYREKKESALENTHVYICNYEPSNNRSRESSLMISRQTLQLLLSDPLSFFPLSLLRLTSYIQSNYKTYKAIYIYAFNQMKAL